MAPVLKCSVTNFLNFCDRSLLIDCCCEDDDLLLFTVKCLLQNSSYPGESSKACECGFPW